MIDYKICSTCVMDTTDPDIAFDDNGVCNHCNQTKPMVSKFTFSQKEEEENLEKIRLEVKKRKKGEYDCIIGLSGGVDSSYLAYLAVEILKLKPIFVHFDNGWNADIAVSNINKIVEKYGCDLYTHVVDWEEFKELQRSFLKASVVDVELLTDQAIQAVMYKVAKKYKVNTTLSGGNFRTEHGMPQKWFWFLKQDVKNIKAIYSKFGDKNVKLKTYPFLSSVKQKVMQKTGRGLYTLQPFDFINYNKPEVLKILQSELGWQDYGGKHKESLWTKFYQDYYLPKKFNIDKRRVHLSALIRFKMKAREEALSELHVDVIEAIEREGMVDYVRKKLSFSEDEFDSILASQRIEHDFYESELLTMRKWQERYHKYKHLLPQL